MHGYLTCILHFQNQSRLHLKFIRLSRRASLGLKTLTGEGKKMDSDGKIWGSIKKKKNKYGKHIAKHLPNKSCDTYKCPVNNLNQRIINFLSFYRHVSMFLYYRNEAALLEKLPTFKGTGHRKKRILSSFIHHYVIPNLTFFLWKTH